MMLEAVHMPGVLTLTPPRCAPTPLVFDSPHSGAHYPRDFDHILTEPDLRRFEDAFVDELFDHVPEYGAVLLRALFPRSYIDVNRAADDLDASMFAGRWPHAVNPSAKTRRGTGLLFRFSAKGPLYNRKLTLAEVRRRLDGYYWPYHQALKRALDQTWQRHGMVLHINCHSMGSSGIPAPLAGAASRRADFILGDRDGHACAPQITARVAQHLRAQGFEVALNAPFKGAELVRRYAAPAVGRHSLQIEINRDIYMHERSIVRHEGFETLKTVLRSLTKMMAEAVRRASPSFAPER